MSGIDVVLIPGAWCGPWIWKQTASLLKQAGHRPLAVHLPGVGCRADFGATLDDAVNSALRQMRTRPGPFLIVGHGSGGVIATEVAERSAKDVAGVVFVAGYLLPSGMTYGQIMHRAGLEYPRVDVGPLVHPADHRASVLSMDLAWDTMFHDAAQGEAFQAVLSLAPQSEGIRLAAPHWTPSRFGSIPKLYIETLRDRAVPLAPQRHMQQVLPDTYTATLSTGHAPMIAAPQDVHATILQFTHDLPVLRVTARVFR